ncbi:F0F1 ATP synthase subunit A [Ruminococcus sp. YH-rum2234]|uniref:ATP synthase subunit a n=2 Tax=Fusibacillus kribbianus TaxID=3044208 RepID=A0AAP4BDR2_9FIRM|nr:F0F1 ATP synthase subunit A [Ruminococcus sp. YH-rum2234]MDI9243066.1 F0F1 ATP synthase subunit A [Ruminococcus sp. YH-rum2234]
MILCEADFAIHGLVNYKLFGHSVWLTTTHVAMVIVTIVILIFAIAANRCMKKAKEVPTGFQNVVELIVEMLGKMVTTNMKQPKKFLNYIGTLFLFILICNLSGLLGLRGPTADYGVTLCLGLITFCMIQYNGIKCQKMGHFKALFEPIPLFFPINLIGEIATPISLSLRLFANMLAGTIIMALWYGIIPIFIAKLGIPAFLHAYLDLFSGCIQTYVFCMLTMVYVDDKM